MNLIAKSKKTGREYEIVKYTQQIIERGSDTELGKETIEVYDAVCHLFI